MDHLPPSLSLSNGRVCLVRQAVKVKHLVCTLATLALVSVYVSITHVSVQRMGRCEWWFTCVLSASPQTSWRKRRQKKVSPTNATTPAPLDCPQSPRQALWTSGKILSPPSPRLPPPLLLPGLSSHSSPLVPTAPPLSPPHPPSSPLHSSLPPRAHHTSPMAVLCTTPLPGPSHPLPSHPPSLETPVLAAVSSSRTWSNKTTLTLLPVPPGAPPTATLPSATHTSGLTQILMPTSSWRGRSLVAAVQGRRPTMCAPQVLPTEQTVNPLSQCSGPRAPPSDDLIIT